MTFLSGSGRLGPGAPPDYDPIPPPPAGPTGPVAGVVCSLVYFDDFDDRTPATETWYWPSPAGDGGFLGSTPGGPAWSLNVSTGNAPSSTVEITADHRVAVHLPSTAMVPSGTVIQAVGSGSSISSLFSVGLDVEIDALPGGGPAYFSLDMGMSNVVRMYGDEGAIYWAFRAGITLREAGHPEGEGQFLFIEAPSDYIEIPVSFAYNSPERLTFEFRPDLGYASVTYGAATSEIVSPPTAIRSGDFFIRTGYGTDSNVLGTGWGYIFDNVAVTSCA